MQQPFVVLHPTLPSQGAFPQLLSSFMCPVNRKQVCTATKQCLKGSGGCSTHGFITTVSPEPVFFIIGCQSCLDTDSHSSPALWKLPGIISTSCFIEFGSISQQFLKKSSKRSQEGSHRPLEMRNSVCGCWCIRSCRAGVDHPST